MSDHWRIALRCAALMILLAAPVAGAIFYFYGRDQSLAFCYGAGTGIVSFVSTAITVSLLTGRSKVVGVVLGASSFGARYGFAAVALGVPAYLELWPVVAMLIGFAGVYFAETVMLVPWAVRTMNIPGAQRPVGEGVERRTGA
jgi:hypothetical protein